MSGDELAKKLNVSRSTIHRYEKGAIEKMPTETLAKIARILNSDPAYFMGWVDNTTLGDNSQILTGDGDISGTVTTTNTSNDTDTSCVEHGQEVALETQDAILKVQTDGSDVRTEILEVLKEIKKDQRTLIAEVKKLRTLPQVQNEPQIDEVEVDEDLVEYQVYERLAAGTGAAIYDDYSYDTVYYDEEINHDLASWVWGDSMEPAYLNGEVALIKATGFDYDGAVYAVVWDGRTYIKRVYKEEDGLRLVSINPKYSDKFAPYEEEPRIIGMVIGHFMPIEK